MNRRPYLRAAPSGSSRRVLGLALGLVLAACSPEAELESVRITSFTATPSPARVTDDVVLSWALSGSATSVELLQDGVALAPAPELGASGARTITGLAPGAHVFVLRAAAGAGAAVEAEARVEVLSPVEIAELNASPESIRSGEASTISWRTTGAVSAQLFEDDVLLAPIAPASVASGERVVLPTFSRTYRLVATGPGGSAERTVRVEVPRAPLFLSLELTPSRVRRGGTTTLSWRTSQATALEVRSGNVLVHTVPAAEVAEGQKELTVETTTTFDVLATGAGGEALEHRTVVVVPKARIVSFGAQPGEVVVGSSTTLAWVTEGVDDLTLTANGVPVDIAQLDVVDGALEVTPLEDTVYTLTGTGLDGTDTASATVQVHGLPVIESFASDTSSIVLGEGTAVLSWSTRNGTSVAIEDGDGTPVDVSSQPVDAGSVEVAPLRTTSYVLTLIGPGGIVESSPVQVEVTVAAPRASLTLGATSVIEGQTTTLAWTVTGHTTMQITASTGGGAPTNLNLAGRVTSPGSAHDLLTLPIPTGDTVFELTATGPGGTSTARAELVLIRKPVFTSFTSDKQVAGTTEVRVTRGRTFQVSWTTTGAEWTHTLPRRIQADAPPFVSILDQPGTVELTLGNDPANPYSEVPFPGGFIFPFYGASRTTVRMASDGYLCFGGDNVCGYGSSGFHRPIPDSTYRPDLFIAPFHADLTTKPGTRYAMRLDGPPSERRLVFEWNGADFRNLFAAGSPLTFQAVLFENGDWELWNAPRTGADANPISIERWGTTATLGVEGPGGLDGTKVSFDATTALCSSFTPPALPLPALCTPITRQRLERLAASGTETLVADANKVLRMRAIGPAGEGESQTLSLVTYAEPLINRFDSDRTLIGTGESATLTWSTGGDNAVRSLTGGTAPPTIGGGGTLRVTPTETTTYTLKVTNRAGDSITKTVTIRVDKPDVVAGIRNLSAATSDAAATATGAAGDRFELSWQTTSARSLTILDPAGATLLTLTAPGDATRIAAGTLEQVVTQSGSYTVRATNDSGTRDELVTANVSSGLRIVSFAASMTRQTAGEPVALSWETWNATSVDLRVVGETTTIPCSASARAGTCEATARDTRTTWLLTARDGAGNVVTETVSVDVVPRPVAQLSVTPGTVAWNGMVTVDWSAQSATRQRLYQRIAASSRAELSVARSTPAGSLQLTLQRDTTFELVVENELGFVVSAVVGPIDVQVDNLATSLLASTPDVPRGGSTTLTWDTPGSARTTFWQRDPPDAPAFAVGETAGDRVDVPIEAVDHAFTDISATGEEIVLRRGQNVDFSTGFALRDLPDDFTPEFFGLPVGRVLVSASGVLAFAPRGAPDSAFQLCLSSDCSGQNVIQGDVIGTDKYAVLAAFWGRLTARNGCVGPLNCQSVTPPGRVFWQLLGTAPNRRLVVQWDHWDAREWYTAGDYTFEAILQENGDTEVHYKTLQAATADAEGGCFVTAGADRRDGQGRYRNWWTEVSLRRCGGLGSGRGFRMRSGVQAPSGSLSAYVPRWAASSPSRNWFYRLTAENPEAPTPRKTTRITMPQVAGVDEISISELMLSPGANGSQWIELHNRGFGSDISLAGYFLVTPTGAYTFTGGVLPRSPLNSPEGRAVVGPDFDPTTNGGAVVTTTYPATLKLSDFEGYVAIGRGETIIDKIEYGPGWPLPGGRSVSFDPPQTESLADYNDDPFHWCATDGLNGERSTPGAPNPVCHLMEPIPWDPSLDIESDAQATALSTATATNEVVLPFAFRHFGRTNPGPLIVYRWGALQPGRIADLQYAGLYFGPDNARLPVDDGVHNGFYPYWDDLGVTPSSRILYRVLGTAPNRTAVFQWIGFTPKGASGDLNFLVALRENGTFEFQYKTLGEADGSTATIGFELIDELLGVTYGANSPVLPPPGRSVPFGLRYRHKP